ncbi:hypothetical protein [Streptomyces sp. NPDC007088]|uniref:hypothetical protein n=1 Tax=Streptomyces sp. NPDC007088 TaxID=3364773 RepID=UPI0036978C1D
MITPEEQLAEAKRQLGFPGIVVICGSMRFVAEMAEVELRETIARPGKIVFKPVGDGLLSDPVEGEALKVRLDNLHRWRIDPDA